MSQLIGAIYWVFPAIVIALMTGLAVAVSYRIRRTWLVLLLWLALVLITVLVGRLALGAPRDVQPAKGFVGMTADDADAHGGFEARADAIVHGQSATRRRNPAYFFLGR